MTVLDALEPGEIVYATITATTEARPRHPAKTFTATLVFSTPYGTKWDGWLRIADRAHATVLGRLGATCDVRVVEMQVIVRCGWRNRVSNELNKDKI